MTMIAHLIVELDYLAAKKKLNRAYERYNNAHYEYNCISDDTPDKVVKKLTKANGNRYKKLNKAKKRFGNKDRRRNKLHITEYNIAKCNLLSLIINEGKPFMRRGDTNPVALETTIIGLPLGIAVAIIKGGYNIYTNVQDNVKQKKADKARAKAAADEAAAKEKAENEHKRQLLVEEEAEEADIRMMEKAIEESKTLSASKPTPQQHKSAFIAGLINENGFVYTLDDKIIFMYNLGDKPDVYAAEHPECRLFYISPATGNYKQLAAISSELGVRRLIGAAKNKQQQKTQAAHDRIEAQKQIKEFLTSATNDIVQNNR